jgi:predicted dithiol-disulfide oxidoreductase (DUF899 family)
MLAAPREDQKSIPNPHAKLRALPPGGEVSEDYAFDVVGAGGTATVIRMSELFRGGDTLMMYHYMFPRHSGDERPGPSSGAMANVPVVSHFSADVFQACP